MAVSVNLPGSETYPTFRKLCHNCDCEFDFTGSYEDSNNANCPWCHASEIQELYMSFPDDGPGFQKDYAIQSDRLRGGGCSSSCEDSPNFDL